MRRGALGLGYCWNATRCAAWGGSSEEIRPTDVDLRTLQALTALPNGQRGESAGAPGAGLIAELPFLNIGTDRQIFIDLAPPDVSSFVCSSTPGAGGGRHFPPTRGRWASPTASWRGENGATPSRVARRHLGHHRKGENRREASTTRCWAASSFASS